MPSPAALPRVRVRRALALVLATVFAVVLAACDRSPEVPDQHPAAQALVAALQSGSLDDVPIEADPAADPQAQVEEVLAPLKEATGQQTANVTLGEVSAVTLPDGGNPSPEAPATATATLHWVWPFGLPTDDAAAETTADPGAAPATADPTATDAETATETATETEGADATGATTDPADATAPTATDPATDVVADPNAAWSYDTQANLVYVGAEEGQPGAWQVVWDPSILVPGYQPGDEITVAETRPTGGRADILDGAGQPLVTARQVNRIGIDKGAVYGEMRETFTEEELEDYARQLVDLVAASGYTYDPEAYVARVHASGYRAFVDLITLREGDTSIDLDAVQAIPAVNIVPGTQPLAPTSTFARAILGRSGEATAELIEQSGGRLHVGDITGLSGLQQRYDEQLAGQTGITVTKTSADGTETVLWSREPVDGTPLETTFDVALQERAERVLADVGPASAIVAIRPSTGEILAAASGPGSQGQDTALLGQFAPGSTFKVADALAFLRHGLTAESIVPCTDSIDVDGRTFNNVPEYPATDTGDVPLRTAFAHSCNTAMIAVGTTDQAGGPIPAQDLLAAAQDLGFEVVTPIGTPAFYGTVPTDGDDADYAATLLGQGRVLASPFTMARLAASVAAGHRVDPFLVRSAADATTDVAVGNLTEAEAAQLRDLMSAVVTEGSASMLSDVPGIGGAKTGTAQFGDGTQTHTWMIAFTDPTGPDGDLAVAVFVEEGERGSTTSGPLMHAFLTGQ